MKDTTRHNGLRRFKVVVCLAAILPIVLGGAGDFVLCFGEDGHIAIEVAHGEPCDSHGSRGGAGTSSHMDENEPGALSRACFDIPIMVHGSNQPVYHKFLSGKDNGRDRISTSSVAPEESSGISPVYAAAHGAVLRSIPPPSRSHLAHRTTVLLI